MVNFSETSIWEQILSLYIKFFHYTATVGLFPYEFNAESLKLSPIESGLSYYLFIFNVIWAFIHNSKSALLFILNFSTNFEFEEYQAGYFFQLIYLTGFFLMWGMMYCYVWNRATFASTLTSCIRLEKEFVIGKYYVKYYSNKIIFVLHDVI